MNLPHNPILREGAVMPRLAAIILAAGYSSRMMSFKPLLPLAGSTVIERVIRVFFQAGIRDVVVVAGYRAEELQPIVERTDAVFVLNQMFEQGMSTSICAGIQALPQEAEASFLLPVDIPLVRASTIRQLVAALGTSGKQIIYPLFQDERGHPPLIALSLLKELLSDGLSTPFCSLLERHENKVCDVQVCDEAIHLDMDTPADYARIYALAESRDIPSVGECEAILANQKATPSLLHHSQAVANVACGIASALNHHGSALNLSLVRAGGLLHDIAKGMPDHAGYGAKLLRAMEFPRVAEVVAEHTDLDFSGRKLDEAAIVYLADKLVRGETLTTLSHRFEPALFRFRHDPEALKAVHRRLATAREIASAVEQSLGVTLDAFLSENIPKVPALAVWQPTCITG